MGSWVVEGGSEAGVAREPEVGPHVPNQCLWRLLIWRGSTEGYWANKIAPPTQVWPHHRESARIIVGHDSSENWCKPLIQEVDAFLTKKPGRSGGRMATV